MEVKCFPENRSALDEFYHAVGQYMVYREALRLNAIDIPVFLAIPRMTFDSLFQKAVVQAIINGSKIKLIVIDLEREEVILWTS